MNLAQTTEWFGTDDQSWLGSEHGTQATETIVLDTSTFTAATHYPDGFFKSGIPLGQITAGGKFGPYDNAAADGREKLVGFLFSAVGAPTVNTIDPAGEGGGVRLVSLMGASQVGLVRAARVGALRR
ncbi:head decoration protein [Streptomyces sp. SID7834]|nr:head decoration protein [Streptomyces sp. SID7834]MYT60149.1 head decoration protein [Streptomyces sp. SID7834]